jgi:hypothetical protein
MDRDTRPPLLRLPLEVIIHICLMIPDVEHRRMDLNYFMSTCRLIRDIALSVPELWTMIGCSWRPEWIELCIQRAANQPLHIDFDGWTGQARSEPLYSNIYRCSSAIISNPWTSGKALNICSPAPLMHSITILDVSRRPSFRIDNTILGGQHSRLTSLKLTSIHVLRPLSLPNLQRLSLAKVNITFPHLYKFLFGSPGLEEIHVEMLYKPCHPTFQTRMLEPTVPLDRLRCLSIHDSGDIVRPLLQHLPDPSLQLHLHFEDVLMNTWKSSTQGEDAAVLSRVLAFSRSRLGTGHVLPMSLIINNVGGEHRSGNRASHVLDVGLQQPFGSETSRPMPSIWWQTSCEIEYENADPIFSSITTVIIYFRSVRMVFYPDDERMLESLTGIKHLFIRDWSISGREWSSGSAKHDFERMMAWFADYAEKYGLLESIEFSGCCAKARPYAEQLATKVSAMVTWKS